MSFAADALTDFHLLAMMVKRNAESKTQEMIKHSWIKRAIFFQKIFNPLERTITKTLLGN